jgi:tRNA U38,U39,U40 pseudouridine synthase TruA
MAAYRLTIAYDGTPFAGWAVQPGLRTVQAEMEGALARILGEPVSLTVAGRTDAGVHAWEQVASFELDGQAPDQLAHRLELWIEADAFMRHMVRILVGTMLEVAGGRRTVEGVQELLRGAPRERAGETAPPHGLYLAAVGYG